MTQIHAVTMPKWGLEMTEGTVAAWHIPEGAEVSQGAELADIETAKIVNTLEAQQAGTVRRLLAKVGDTLPVGALIAVLAESSIADSEVEHFIENFKSVKEVEEKSVVLAPKVEAQSAEVNATPLARRLAQELGVDLACVKGTGRNGKISQEDVEAAASAAVPVTSPPPSLPTAGPRHSLPPVLEDTQSFELSPHSAMRKTIGETMVRAKQLAPHFYLTMDIDVDALLGLRGELNAREAATGKLSLNDFILRASALALKQVPDVNVHYSEQGVKRFHAVNLGLAVAVEGGLLVPVIHDAVGLNVWKISERAGALARRARARSLKEDDLSGGTFSISNLGMFGVHHFEAIINPPQGAILAVGAVRREAREIAGGVGFVSVISVTVSCDHRVIDGAMGARFLSVFKSLIEDPFSLIV